MEIDGRPIVTGEYPYVIAEVSANHDGSLPRALELIHAAKESGADAVKLQHYTTETITVRSEHPDFRVKGGTLWDGRQLADLYAEAMTPWEWTEELVDTARQLNISWFSSPFDTTAVDYLANFDVPAYKIASFEVIDLPLIRYAAQHGKPMVISTGMASVGEIDAAVAAALDAGAPSVALLRCNSGYPALPHEMDLRAIPVMRELWGVPIGLSDHTIGYTAAVAAVALGACIIEKHLTLKRTDGGPDAEFSAEPDELTELVHAVRDAHAALGTARFGPSPRENASRAFRRSLRAVQFIPAGCEITSDLVRSVRPSGGLAPDEIHNVLGRVAERDLQPGDPITWDALGPRVLGR
jgi:pseudaminic acid synthase